MDKLLANYTIYNSKVYVQCVTSVANGKIEITKLEKEIAFTKYLDSYLIIGNKSLLEEMHINKLNQIVSLGSECAKKICAYMDNNRLNVVDMDNLPVVLSYNIAQRRFYEIK